MNRWLAVVALVLLVAAPVSAADSITGQYVEARTTDVWTGPCFANAETNLGGKQAVLAWKVDKGSLDQVKLDGLSVVAVLIASDTLGMEQTGPARAILIVDEKADAAQKQALVRLVKEQAGKLVSNVVAVRSANVDMKLLQCKDGVCARVNAGDASVTTRCLDHHDKVCGNESAFYPPLTKGVKANAALAVEFGFTGKGLNETWKEAERRGAYVGSFSMK